ERWVPVHGIVAMSDGEKVWAEIKAAFDELQDEFGRHKIMTGFLVTTMSNTGFLIEPVFVWPEALYAIHKQTVEESYLRKTGTLPDNPEATALVTKARQLCLDIFSKHAAAHFQIGRTYPYRELRQPEVMNLLERIKHIVDPGGRINPGALGLNRPSGELTARNPRTGERDYRFKAASASDVTAQAKTQREASRPWREANLDDRCTALLRFADILEERRGAIAHALEVDTGRRRIARMEVNGVAASIRGWAAQAPHLLPTSWVKGRQNPDITHTSQYRPYELVGVIAPWNFTLTLSMIDTIPALLAGAAVMVKPSEVTPRFVAPLSEAIEAAGLGHVLHFAQGDGATGEAIVRNADIVCFTGSVGTGRKVAVAAAEAMIPAFLELGGKDPLIVLEHADLDLAADAALRGSVLSTGQACQSIERIYVARSVHDEFIERLVAKAEAVQLNYPDIDRGHLGPIIFEKQVETLRSQIDQAAAQGASLLTGGEIENHGGGFWLRPTVITNVDHTMDVMRDETFGPIMPVMPFDTIDQAVELANDTVYGLSAAVFGATLDEAEAVARRIDAGAVSLNDAALTALFHEAEKESFGLSGMGPSRMGAS
ncbi:MAG: aldehyde dehydrogenase family protein, partial [Pseudomonadota bacterium]